MSDNGESPSTYFDDCLEWTNWILYAGATFNMVPQVLDFILVSLKYRDKYIEVEDGHHVTSNQKVKA